MTQELITSGCVCLTNWSRAHILEMCSETIEFTEVALSDDGDSLIVMGTDRTGKYGQPEWSFNICVPIDKVRSLLENIP